MNPTKITLTNHSIRRSLERLPNHLITTSYQTNPHKYCKELTQLAKQALKSCITLEYLSNLSEGELVQYNLSGYELNLILTKTGYSKSFSKDLYYWYKNCVFIFYKGYNSKNVVLKTIIDLETFKTKRYTTDIPCACHKGNIPCKDRVYFNGRRYR